MAQVHNKGLTQLYDGNSIIGEPPKVNIVFIHGLGGHPRRTWSAEYSTAGSDLGGRRSSADTSSTGRKNSTTGWSRFLKRSNTGTPVSLADRSNSIVPSVISTEEPVSPRQIFENPSAMEPEIAPTPALSTNKKSVYWPQDLLPQDFPDARIYTFGYDSKVATMSSTGQRAKLTFTQHAHDLHMTLNKELDDVTPIILCAHSLGGVLSKRALWESKTANNPELQKLARLTKVIIFFGTPHKGARKARFGEIATQVVSMAKLDTAQHLVSSLKLDSEILDIIHADFLKLLRAGDFYVHTFSEGRSINSTFGKIVEEYSSRIDEVSELQMHEVIDGDHRTMIQYKGAQDPGYRKVVSALKHYMNKLDKKHDIERVSLASMASSRDIPTRTYISVPHERNEETFVGRKDCIDAINMLFLGPKHTPFVVLHGLGGIGKTQVAIELAYRFKHSSPLFSVFWVHAQTAQTLDEGFRKILETLEIPHSAETNVRTAVAEWLRNKMNGRWLLVVDNVDDLSVLDENNGKGRQFKLLSCLPKTDHGHVLFTTRYRTLAVKITKEVVRLDQMSKTESMELLKRSLAGQYDESEEHLAEQLLEELSYIPLAISQAAGYMFEAENTIAQYLEYYRESEETRMELLQQGIVDLQMEDEGTDVVEDEDEEDESKGPKTVLKTSWMSFKRMKSDTATGPLANDLLSIMAFLNRQEIPLSLLKKYRPKAPSLKLNDAFKLLKGYSLVIENTKTNTFSMHRLVQFSLRKWLEKDGKAGQYQKDSLTVLSNNFPDGSFKTWDECKTLIVHADTILEHSTDTDDRAARAKLLQNCANFQNARGQYAAAEEKIQEVVKLRTELVGADNTETLRATDQLAWTLWNQAKKDESLALAQRTLMKKEQLFGKRSVEALTTSHIVATVVGGQGKHQDAAKIHEENIEARNELLGLEHLDTLRSAASLSLELWQLGQFVKAEDLARRTLASREKLLGEEHPDTLEIAGTLGFILEIQGKLVEAEDLKSKMLNTRLNIYGEDHPDTADSYHDMGWIYHQMGRYDDAEPYYENALSAKLRLLGDTHWKTLTTFCNYPVFCCDKGEYDEAEERSKRLIAIFKRVQGDMHPQTLDATGGLAVILRHQGKLEEAAQAARTSIDGRNVVLGPDHPWTLPPVSHWGYILTLQGDHKQGEQVIREALAGLEKSMGKNHNNVLTSLLFLSKNLLRQSTGPEDPVLEESEQLAQRAYNSRKKLLGEEHPYTYKAMHHLGRVKAARGQYEEAHKISLTALGGMRVVLGTTHPDVSLCDIDLRQMEAKMEELGIKRKGDEAEEGEVIDT